MRFPVLSALTMILSASAAHAASTPNLAVDIFPPAVTPSVYDGTARYDVRVRNIGNRNASGVVLTIELPKTGTSPQVYIMGTLGAKDSRCVLAGASGTVAGTKLTCTLGVIARNGGQTIPYFQIGLPVKSDLSDPSQTGPLEIRATATTTTLPETDPGNNTDVLLADLIYKNITITGPRASTIRHCTGQGLTAFFECTFFPSSITSHPTTFEAGGVISIPGEPSYTGTWSQPTPDTLEFKYYLTSNCTVSGCVNPEAEFYGRGAKLSPNQCFEGLTRFPDGLGGYSAYVSPYEVCLQ